MRSPWLVVVLGLAACTDPVIELSFRLPTAAQGGNFNTSCITAVDVVTVGATVDDEGFDCIEIPSGLSSMAAVRDALVGQIDVPLPSSGLTGVELYGRRGNCKFDDNLPPGEVLFYAGAPYIGGEQLVLPIDAMASCDQAPLTVRPVDILALTTGPVKGDCAAAAAVDGPESGGDAGTMLPTMAGVDFWSGFGGGPMSNSIVQITGAPTEVGPKACLAVSSGDARFGSVSCADRSAPAVCAGPGELEAPGIDGSIAYASRDQIKSNQYPGLVFGAVIDGAKQPIQGATVTIDSKVGEIVYVELAGTRLEPTGGSATGPSGLFIAYTNAISDITISANGKSSTRTVGAPSWAPAAALVMLR